MSDLEKHMARNFVEQWEKMGGAYFWRPPASARARRDYEKYHARSLDVEINGIHFEGRIIVDCSCKNIYVTRELLANGEKKRITALKKALEN